MRNTTSYNDEDLSEDAIEAKIKKVDEDSSQRIYHYDKVETQINIEKLYLSLPPELDLDNKIKSSDAESYFLVNPKYNHINKIIKSYFTSNHTQFNSPMILKMKTDL